MIEISENIKRIAPFLFAKFTTLIAFTYRDWRVSSLMFHDAVQKSNAQFFNKNY